MNHAVQVLLLGGPGCGRTTLLAGMFSQLVRGEINRYLTVSDQTIISDCITSVYDKYVEVFACLDEYNASKAIFSRSIHHHSPVLETYSFRLQPQNTWNCDLNVDFFEVPGTMLMSDIHREEFCSLMKQSEVIVIVVDTPFLMEAPVDVNQYQNRIPEILNLLGREDLNGKMVMLVPVKCEKWVKEGRIDEVIEEVKSAYQPLISMLLDYSNINVCILPAETTGGIHFFEFRDAYVLQSQKTFKYDQCCKLTESIVRLRDGTVYHLGGSDTITPDPSFVAFGFNFAIPCAWYTISRKNNDSSHDLFYLYNPKNCEQILLHILTFMTNKLPGIWNTLVSNISNAGLIKNGVDGIEYL